VNVNDIKGALLYRFRKEEVARLGNNYLIYPTFNVATFKKIITRYLDANIAAYRKNTGINITYNDQIVNMIYSEGVFPAQGARSVMSTINNFCSIFSEIDMASSSASAAIKDVEISLPDTITDFKKDDVDIQITFTDINGATTTQSVNYPLHIGRLRNPEHDEARYIKAVHELGHAFMMMIETGRYPSTIVTTSSSSTGGYCIADLEDYFNNSVPTPETVRSRVRISLGGWVAERLVYPSEFCSLGSGSDIEMLWDEIVDSIYKEGFFSPVSYAQGCNDDGTPKGLNDSNVEQSLKKELDYLTNNTIHIVRDFTALLKYLSCPLAEKGSYTQQEFIDVLKAVPEDADADVRKQRDELIKKMDDKATKRPAPSKYQEILADKTYRGSIIFDDKKSFWQRLKAKFKRKK
jgi:cell division protease FtsH